MLLLAGLFLVVFVTVVACVGLGMSYFRSKQKQQIRSMLRKAEASPAEQRSELLRPAEVEDALGKFLSRFEFMDRLELILEQSGKNWSASKLITISLITGIAGAILGTRFAFATAGIRILMCGLAGAFAPIWLVMRKRNKAIRTFEEQFPEALDFLSRSMRAGHGFSVALEMLAADAADPLGSAFRRVSNDLQLGSPLEVALNKLMVLVPLVDVRFFVSSVVLQQETGGNLGEILSKLAWIIRERFRIKGQVKAASAHGRITGLVLVLMPAVVVVLLMMMSPSYLTGMMKDPTGKAMVYGACIGQVVGFFVIRKITNIRV